MPDIRKDKRFSANAQVYIAGVLDDNKMSLKDISTHGCAVHSNEFFAVAPKSRYVIDITPEREANIEKFELGVESRWVRTNKMYSESGFIVLIPSKNQSLERYVDYLSKQNHPQALPYETLPAENLLKSSQ
jgi:hypothetical protein